MDLPTPPPAPPTSTALVVVAVAIYEGGDCASAILRVGVMIALPWRKRIGQRELGSQTLEIGLKPPLNFSNRVPQKWLLQVERQQEGCSRSRHPGHTRQHVRTRDVRSRTMNPALEVRPSFRPRSRASTSRPGPPRGSRLRRSQSRLSFPRSLSSSPASLITLAPPFRAGG